MIVTVGAEKGGVGKTMMALSMGATFASEGLSVIVVDTDSTNSSTAWFDRRADAELPKNFQVVSQTKDPAPSIVDFSTKYDVVMVDVGARDYDKHLDLLKISDFWVIPTQVGAADLQSTVNLCNGLAETAKHSKRGFVPGMIVFNRVRYAVEGARCKDCFGGCRSWTANTPEQFQRPQGMERRGQVGEDDL